MEKETIIQKIAKETLQIEADTLAHLIEVSINKVFTDAVLDLFACKGRIIVTGIGKSAIIGQKMVATLNSTGTPSVFMHAADAIHGDLGILQPEDLLICLSKSGNTSELKVLVNFVKKTNNRIIAIVSNLNSFLAKNATHTIYAPILREAEPNNLAPTASTTAQMAIGDAIASALLALKGFSPANFAQYHPGGSLGKQLYLKVDELAADNEVPAVQEHDDIRTIIIEMTSKRLGSTAVVNQANHLVGIITDGDLRRMIESQPNLSTILAKDIMTPNPKSIELGSLAIEALRLVKKYAITQLPVVRGFKYVGMIHLHDLIREGLV